MTQWRIWRCSTSTPEEVDRRFRREVETEVRAILDVFVGCDAFDVIELLRLREFPLSPELALDDGHDGVVAVVELVTLLLLARGARTVGDAAEDAVAPHEAIDTPDTAEFIAWYEQLPTMLGVAGTSIRPDTPQGVKTRLSERLPLAALLVIAATLVLRFLMTGSLIVPIKAVAMNILSLGASFGALVWIFQEGHLAGPLALDSVGALDLWMPVLILIFAFGLSMDYEVFLLSRIKEVHDETGDNDLAVAVGLQRSGRIITSAAFLIVIVLAGFAAGEVLAIKQLGVGLAIAVLIDATIVRTLLVPATMKLLGERNWWAPAPLRRLHQRFGLHEAPPAAPPKIVLDTANEPQPKAEVETEPVGAASGTMQS